MHKEKIHPISEIFNSDGSPNHSIGQKGIAHYLGQESAHHYHIEHGAASETVIGPGRTAVMIAFHRVDNNPGEAAATPAPIS
jgi:hypothetical protein